PRRLAEPASMQGGRYLQPTAVRPWAVLLWGEVARLSRSLGLLGHLGHGFLAAPGHLIRSDILDVGRERPRVAERLQQFAEAIAPEHVGWRHLRFRSGRHGLFEDRVHIFHIEENAGRRATDRFWGLGTAAWHLIGKHELRVPDLKFGMADLSIRSVHT